MGHWAHLGIEPMWGIEHTWTDYTAGSNSTATTRHDDPAEEARPSEAAPLRRPGDPMPAPGDAAPDAATRGLHPATRLNPSHRTRNLKQAEPEASHRNAWTKPAEGVTAVSRR